MGCWKHDSFGFDCGICTQIRTLCPVTLDLESNGSGPNNLDPRGADNQDKFEHKLEKLTIALAALNADIVGLVELENDFDASLLVLVDAVNAHIGKEDYEFVSPRQQYVDMGTWTRVMPFLLDSSTNPRSHSYWLSDHYVRCCLARFGVDWTYL
jgi:hypothetical protein